MSTISALGSPVYTGQSGAGSTAGLDAQLARYQVQLSDWVNLSSCNIPEGKANIQELSDKVHETKQIDRPNVQVAGLGNDGNQNKTTPTINVAGSGSRSSIDPASASGAVGTQLNVYA